jgi:hypothetical protein
VAAVDVTFSCADALSGVASCPGLARVTAGGITTVTRTATDVVGNQSSHSRDVKIDRELPSTSITSGDPLFFGSPVTGRAVDASAGVQKVVVTFKRGSLNAGTSTAQCGGATICDWQAYPARTLVGDYDATIVVTDMAGRTRSYTVMGLTIL